MDERLQCANKKEEQELDLLPIMLLVILIFLTMQV